MVGPFSPQQFDLVRLLARRRFTERFQGTLFGWIWLVIGPLATIALLSFVFGTLLGVRWDIDPRAPYPVVLFSGLVVHFFLSECLMKSPNLIIERPELVHQMAFPFAIVAVVNVLDIMATFLIALAVFLLVSLLSGFSPSVTWLLLPVVVLPLCLYGLALSWGLSAIGVYLRDINQISGQLSTALLLFSPVLYPLSSVPAAVHVYYYLNPTTVVVNNLRLIVFTDAVPASAALTLPILASLILSIIGYIVFDKLKNGFSDVV
jgi:lipopolysaccharide transport system permease protein